jgi:RNA polymerase sigma-70 factor (ECF subfamily)
MNRADLEVLVRSQQAELYRYVRYLGVAESAEAEDLVQETFLAACRSREGPTATDLRGQAAWLRGIARNLFLAHCRRRRRNPVRVDNTALEQAEAVWVDEFLRGDDGFDYLLALRRCLERLTAKPRQLLEMRYTAGKSRAEMARLLEMTEEGIKSSLQRVRALLADCIRRRLAAEEA